MKWAPINNIHIPQDRIRREFLKSDLDALSQSIGKHGLIHPIVCDQRNDGSVILRAGERRLRAMLMLNDMGPYPIQIGNEVGTPGYVPYIEHSELSLDAARRLEVEENVLRKDFTWQERAQADRMLHNLRSEDAVAAGTVQTMAATATEILGKPASGATVQAVRNRVILAENLHDPDIAGAKNEKEAFNILQRKAEIAHREILAQTFVESASSHLVMNEDCMSGLLKLTSHSVDVVITDPPYGVNAHTFTPQSGSDAGFQHEYEDTPEYAFHVIATMANLSYVLAKEQAHMYMFCDIRMWPTLKGIVEEAGWSVWPTPIIWSKSGRGNIVGKVNGPRRTYEAILYAHKGDKPVLKVGIDVIDIPPVKSKHHAAQKPVALYMELLSWSCRPGDVVLDPFMGSGTILPAANGLSLHAIGIELNKDYFNAALTRLNEKPGQDEGDDLEF